MRTVRSSGRISGGGVGGCTWSWGDVPGPGGCTWSGGGGVSGPGEGVPGPGGVPGLGGVPGPRGVYLVQAGVPGPGGVPGLGGTWSWGVNLVHGGVPGPWGVYLVPGGAPSLYLVREGVPGPGGYLVPEGVPGHGGCTWSRGDCLVRYSPHCGQTHACKNITFATSLRTVKMWLHLVHYP